MTGSEDLIAHQKEPIAPVQNLGPDAAVVSGARNINAQVARQRVCETVDKPCNAPGGASDGGRKSAATI